MVTASKFIVYHFIWVFAFFFIQEIIKNSRRDVVFIVETSKVSLTPYCMALPRLLADLTLPQSNGVAPLRG